jgi:large subunit ribosomal protein L30e
MVDASKEIRRAVDTGKVAFGSKQSIKELLKGNGSVVIVSSNIPAGEKEKLKHITELESKKFYEFDKNGLTLGSICGKPFVVSALIVLDAGKSKIDELQ